jgi:hypothetical protein
MHENEHPYDAQKKSIIHKFLSSLWWVLESQWWVVIEHTDGLEKCR